MSDIRAICFDAFGTVCHFLERHRPYEQFFAELGTPPKEAAHLAMTTDCGFVELAHRLDEKANLDELLLGLEAESESIRLFDDVLPALSKLEKKGVQAWIVSNLARPYGEPVRRLLGDVVAGFSFSFEVGAIKPDSTIFAHACAGLGLPPEQVLMIGDSRVADVEGAQAFGMHAVWLRRCAETSRPESVTTLTELIDHLWRGSGPRSGS